jgi:hypothetical protein
VYALNARAIARRASEGWLTLDVDAHDKLPSDPSGNIPRNYGSMGGSRAAARPATRTGRRTTPTR